MFNKSTAKKLLILLVALLVCATFVFAACNGSNKFTPVSKPDSATAEGNGGAAVRYGEYIYYVNGYQSSSTEDNAYNSDIRTGSIVRIKIADLEKIIKINIQDATTTNKNNAIKYVVAGKADKVKTESLKEIVKGINGAETVIPNYYYTGNTTSTALNGIYIFNDRIYITTPNNELDANGNVLNSQLVIASYDLGGGNMQRHFVFASNAPQLKLSQLSDNTVCATFVLDNKLSFVKLGDKLVKDATVISEDISSAQFAQNNVFFLNKQGSICRYTIGEEKPVVLVPNKVEEGHEDHDHSNTYTIKSVNGDYVYYTASEDTTSILYAANAPVETNTAVLNTLPSGNFYGWNDKVVYTASVPEEAVSMYGIWVSSGDGKDRTEVLDPAQNGTAITFNKLEGNILYYTSNSISYTLDLSVANAKPVAYAYSLSTSATGWSVPDVLSFDYNNGTTTEKITYVFTLGTGEVTVVKFNPERNNNNIPSTSTSSSVKLTLTVIDED